MSADIDPEVVANGRFYSDQLHGFNARSGRDHPLSIRLLYIEPGCFGHAIKASLQTCELADAPPYKALSYSWGEKAGLEIIHLDRGFHFRVRRNLENALQRLRHPSETVCIWIDGICINQADTRERNSQVRHMGEIYARADEVLVWLGETRPLPSAERPLYGDAISLHHQGDTVWWKRLWVVQEFSSARSLAKILFGSTTLDWKSFLSQWQELCAPTNDRNTGNTELQSPEGNFFDDGMSALKTLDKLWNAGPGRSSLYQMLLRTQGHICSDSHDKVYALLHLLHEAEQRIFAPDYDRPIEQLYARATVHFIKTNIKGFGVLLQHWYRGCETWPHAWWLDFTRPRHKHTIPFLYSRQNAGKSMPIEVELAMIPDPSEMPGNSLLQPQLHIKGFLVDEIDMTTPFLALFNPKTGFFDPLRMISFCKHVRLREKKGYLTYFSQKSEKSFYKRQRALPLHMKAIRVGLIKSLLALYRTYAEELSPRLTRSLEVLNAIPEEFLRPVSKELGEPDSDMFNRLDKDILEHLSFVMQRALRMLSGYDIFITTLGFVGFSRHSDDTDNKTNRGTFRGPLPRDLVVVPQGGSFPFILRPPEFEEGGSITERLVTGNWSFYKQNDERLFTIVDGCCMPAISGGEIVELAQQGELQADTFTLGELWPGRRRKSKDLLESPGPL